MMALGLGLGLPAQPQGEPSISCELLDEDTNSPMWEKAEEGDEKDFCISSGNGLAFLCSAGTHANVIYSVPELSTVLLVDGVAVRRAALRKRFRK